MLIESMPERRIAEIELVQAAKSGNSSAFGALYERYRSMVHGILLSHVCFSDAEDLMHDVFMTAMRRIPGLRDTGAFGGWLVAIARNVAIDYQRRSIHTVEANDANCGPARQNRENQNREQISAADVLRVIKMLPESYRETLILRLVEGLTGPEIAARTGLQQDSVRVNLCRGMKMLRERLR